MSKPKTASRSGSRGRANAFEKDYHKFSLLLVAVFALFVLLFIFYISADTFFRIHVSATLNRSLATTIVESLNFHGYQVPPGFAQELLAGKKDSQLVASQAINYPDNSVLRFVSFESSLSPSALVEYYQRYLHSQLFYQQAWTTQNSALQIAASRGDITYDLTLIPLPEGNTLVSIYNNILR